MSHKGLFVVVITLSVFFNVQAQDTSKSTKLGVKAGVNFANFFGDVEDARMKTGFHVGVMAEAMLNNNMSIQSEITFSTQGAREKYTERGYYQWNDVVTKYKINYLNVPVVFKYYVLEGLSLEAGPQLGILMSAKAYVTVDYSGLDQSGSAGRNVDLDESVKPIDFGLVAGFAYRLKNDISLGFRYNFGLTNINDEVDADSNVIKNGVMQVSLGYYF
ncbi:porin family protein [Xanthomarina sp. F2636L]|uniref:porin family protein n=1 Tax=Xanthomarina sp. F2636L TaxID=2996018 RepID=UPI00225E0791|nr:porin family protein [Xanthomarina sp. F2636L]MCX7550449.1 porin family protein [Xanthomarina sp. F2636L]